MKITRAVLVSTRSEEQLPFVAAVNGHDAIVRYLVGKSANITAITKSSYGKYGGMSPLYGALNLIDRYEEELLGGRIARPLREKKTDVVRFLLEIGTKPSALDKYNFPNWMTNLGNSNTTAISVLINHGMRLDQRNPNNGDTVFHHWAATSRLPHGNQDRRRISACRRQTAGGEGS